MSAWRRGRSGTYGSWSAGTRRSRSRSRRSVAAWPDAHAGGEAARLAAVLDRLPHERTAAASVIERGEAAVEHLRGELAQAEEVAAHARRDREGRERAVELAARGARPATEELVSARGRAEALAGAQATAEREAAAVVSAAAARRARARRRAEAVVEGAGAARSRSSRA